MFKKVLVAGLMLTVMLSASACGKEPNGTSGTTVDTPAESSTVESQPTEETTGSQPTEEGTESLAGDASQPTEEVKEEAAYSYIFSEMPIAAYEVTGLGVGPDAEVYAENITMIDEDGEEYDMGVIPLVKLDPANTFILFCIQGADEDYTSVATIHSPSGSDRWKAKVYTCMDCDTPEIEGYSCGYPALTQGSTYDEEKLEGKIVSFVDPWTEYLQFSEIYHPDAPQEDAIHIIEIVPFTYDENYDEADKVMAEMVCTFEKIGATNMQEIPVEEAMARCNVIVAEDGAN